MKYFLITALLAASALCVRSNQVAQQCYDSTRLAVSLSELEDAVFECAVQKCGKVKEMTRLATTLRQAMIDKAGQCLGAPVLETDNEQEIHSGHGMADRKAADI